MQRMLSAKDITRLRGVSLTTHFRDIREGRWPAGEKVGQRAVRWPESVVEAALDTLDPGRKKAPMVQSEPKVSRIHPAAANHRPVHDEPTFPDSDVEAAAQWLAGQQTPARPIVPVLRAMFGFTPLEACAVAARAFDLRSTGGDANG